MGRFISSDVLVYTGQGLLGNNMFAYCLNNPVNYFDYSGEFAVSVTLIKWAIAAGASAISNAVSMKISGGSVTDCLLAALAGAIGGTVGFLISSIPIKCPQKNIWARAASTFTTDVVTTLLVEGEVNGEDLALAGVDTFFDVNFSMVYYYYNPFDSEIYPVFNSTVDALFDVGTDIFQTKMLYSRIEPSSPGPVPQGSCFATPNPLTAGGKYAQYISRV